MNKDYFDEFKGVMAYIEVELPNGDISIGSAFHIGEGVFVTARHVLENCKILSIATTEGYHEPDENGNVSINGKDGKFRYINAKELSIKSGPYFHPDEKVDLGIIVCNETDIKIVKLGGHFDDWINDSQFVLFKTLVMGYPPIPFSQKPVLFTASAEINAVIDKYNAPHPHFIISAMPRGGFSGGLCLIGDCALGVIVESLVKNNREAELGYMSVLSIEPIYVCLKAYSLIPKVQNEF